MIRFDASESIYTCLYVSYVHIPSNRGMVSNVAPVAWPHGWGKRESRSSETLRQQLKRPGLWQWGSIPDECGRSHSWIASFPEVGSPAVRRLETQSIHRWQLAAGRIRGSRLNGSCRSDGVYEMIRARGGQSGGRIPFLDHHTSLISTLYRRWAAAEWH